MLRNYLAIAYRTLRRRLGYTVLNVLGLAVGLACCVLIGLWMQDELSYDAFHANADRTYRVVRAFDMPTLDGTYPYTPPALASTVEDRITGVQAAVRTGRREGVVQHETQKYVESQILYADAGFFEVFDFRVLRGEAALERPGTVLLTPAMADKYFPDEDPVGQQLQLNRPVEVTGIVAPPPGNSSIEYDFVASLAEARWADTERWSGNNFETFVLLEPGQQTEGLEEQLVSIVETHLAPLFEEAYGRTYSAGDYELLLQPLTGIHLGQGVPGDIASAGSWTYLYLFGALALFVLLLACANFMNLATARFTERTREVGVRKALGARRRQLMGQFLGESTLIAALALGVALALSAALLPAFNTLAGKDIAWAALLNGPALAGLGALVAVVGLVAGSYPALVLSRYEPNEVLQGRSSSGSAAGLRKGLVVLQFAISVGLIASTGIVHQQLQFLQSAGLGFQQENVLLIENARALDGQHEAFKQQLQQQAAITGVTSGFAVPGRFHIDSMWRPSEPEATDQNLDYAFVGPRYLETLGIDLVAGRGFSADRATDSTAVVLNKAAAQKFGWGPEEAIGRNIQSGAEAETQYTVIGVTENYHFESLRQEVYALALFPQQAQWQRQVIAARVAPGQTEAALGAVRDTWSSFSDLAFNYAFLADDLAAQYETEQRLQRVFGVGAGVALLIACLGLFSLAAFTVQRRTKEIGIRKAVGASVAQVVGLVSKDFLTLVGIAIAVALPLSYAAMQQWLQDFAYRTAIGPALFLGAAGLALGVAVVTVSYHAAQAARIDPARTLRDE
jgi:putative ABC transport system permease protein